MKYGCWLWQQLVEVITTLVDKVVIIVGIVLSGIFCITGGKDDMIECLLVFMAMDYVTGMIKSVVLKKLNSKVGFTGFLKKFMILCMVVVAARLDVVLKLTGTSYNCRFITLSFYIANEGLSVLENLALAGLPVPEKIKDILEQYQESKKGK